jgi:hypothetical protein
VIIEVCRRALELFRKRQTIILVIAVLSLMLTPGMMGRLFPSHELTDASPLEMPAIPASLPVPHLVHLAPGARLANQSAPTGWSDLVIKSVPNLATGDLDTVSSQAFETARRIRPVIVADIRRAEPKSGYTFYLARVGVGLCAPDKEGDGDRTISASSVEGTRDSWTTKQRIILTAMALEVARTQLAAATPTFALLRSPNTFLIAGSHRKVQSYQALLVDPQSGRLRVTVWRDGPDLVPAEASESPARLLSAPIFDSPQDVHATRVLGTPIAWSFAIRDLPPGIELSIPASVVAACKTQFLGSAESAAVEQALIDSIDDLQ